MVRSPASAFVHRQPSLFWAARASGGSADGQPGRSSCQPDPLELSYIGHPTLGKSASGHTRGNVVLVGDREDLFRGLEYLRRPLFCSLKAEALELVSHLDHTASVDHVIGRVHDAALAELPLHRGVRELVVRSPADDA